MPRKPIRGILKNSSRAATRQNRGTDGKFSREDTIAIDAQKQTDEEPSSFQWDDLPRRMGTLVSGTVDVRTRTNTSDRSRVNPIHALRDVASSTMDSESPLGDLSDIEAQYAASCARLDAITAEINMEHSRNMAAELRRSERRVAATIDAILMRSEDYEAARKRRRIADMEAEERRMMERIGWRKDGVWRLEMQLEKMREKRRRIQWPDIPDTPDAPFDPYPSPPHDVSSTVTEEIDLESGLFDNFMDSLSDSSTDGE